ncbi:sigma-70 family RNA polymerase sigma factor [Pedobacter sp. HX-22-1]|jgi:RNA polymerase sigma-70 factor (ECF subfamily)|uniref:RNA polymerase sigma factor n=1 Tax=Pedobacter puniceum TaxID=2666136 RepID=A0A7K0FIQ1_9SPHI|nr:RNA polymerase sigma factor [Pedobacter puniceum]MRX45856.1 sigma-70 family RNA polymerase sigma factor [Pedobacter puniceum]
MQIEDSEILEKFNNPQTQELGFKLLLNKYQQKIYWHIRRIVIEHEDADDVVQDVFIKVWKNLESFRQDSQLYTWLYRIATNESITFLNKKKTKFNSSFEELSEKLSESLNDDNYFTGDQIQKKLQKALLTLPEKQRLVFNMKYYDDLKFQEISDILGTSVGALKASYHLAVKKIEQFLLASD